MIQAGDVDLAVAGGNVCAVAQRRGVAGLIVDGVIRDVTETRENRFPLFARGVIPKPGAKELIGEFGIAVVCGGVEVAPGDVVVAGEEGIVVVPASQQESILRDAQAVAEKEKKSPPRLTHGRQRTTRGPNSSFANGALLVGSAPQVDVPTNAAAPTRSASFASGSMSPTTCVIPSRRPINSECDSSSPGSTTSANPSAGVKL